MWLRDSGILDKILYDVIRPMTPIPDPQVRRDQPLILSQLGIVMIVLAVGLVLSIPVFLCELKKGRVRSNSNQLKDFNEPNERQHLMLNEVASLTLHYYGKILEESLATWRAPADGGDPRRLPYHQRRVPDATPGVQGLPHFGEST